MSSAGSCLQTRPSTASLAWPRTLAPTVSPEPSTTCRSLPPCMERATSEHSVSCPDAGPPAYSNQPPRPLKCPVTTLLFIFFCMSLALSFCHYPMSPPAFLPLHLSSLSTAPSHSVSVVFASHAMQQLSRFTKRERQKIFCFLFLFSCCHCFSS